MITKGIRTSRRVFDLLETAAKSAKVTVQVDIDEGHTWTDADPISARRTGVPVQCLSVPCRYMHTPCEVIHLDDLEKAATLLGHFVSTLPARVNLAPK